MSNKKFKINAGSNFVSLLFLLFLGLKLSNHIDWSWWWVFSPIWIPFVLVVSVMILFGLIHLLIK